MSVASAFFPSFLSPTVQDVFEGSIGRIYSSLKSSGRRHFKQRAPSWFLLYLRALFFPALWFVSQWRLQSKTLPETLPTNVHLASVHVCLCSVSSSQCSKPPILLSDAANLPSTYFPSIELNSRCSEPSHMQSLLPAVSLCSLKFSLVVSLVEGYMRLHARLHLYFHPTFRVMFACVPPVL